MVSHIPTQHVRIQTCQLTERSKQGRSLDSLRTRITRPRPRETTFRVLLGHQVQELDASDQHLGGGEIDHHQLLPWHVDEVVGHRCHSRRHSQVAHSVQEGQQLLKRVRMAISPTACGCQNRFGIPFWLVGAPPILEPMIVVGLGCSLGVRDFDPWPNHRTGSVKLCVLVLTGAHRASQHAKARKVKASLKVKTSRQKLKRRNVEMSKQHKVSQVSTCRIHESKINCAMARPSSTALQSVSFCQTKTAKD